MEKKPRAATGRDSDKYIIRFLPGLKARVEEAARSAGRSVNAEINTRLVGSFAAEDSVANKRWQVQVDSRANEVRIETLRAHLATLRLHLDLQRQSLVKVMSTTPLDADAMAKVNGDMRSAMIEERRINAQIENLLAESMELQQREDEISAAAMRAIEHEVDLQLQAEYADLVRLKTTVGLPLGPDDPQPLAGDELEKFRAELAARPAAKKKPR